MVGLASISALLSIPVLAQTSTDFAAPEGGTYDENTGIFYQEGENITPRNPNKSLGWEFTKPSSKSDSNTVSQSATDFNDFVAPPGGTYDERTGVFYQEDENLVVP